MRLLITGTEGQVARALLERAERFSNHEAVAVGRPELDLGRPDTIGAALERVQPQIVISAAAYTKVDLAEDEPEVARCINGLAPGVLAREAKRIGARIIHLSTDYVFSGDATAPYTETDQTDPQSVYGLSKLAGEEAVLRSGHDHLVVRTAWVYSPFGQNFVKTMLRLAAEHDEIRVVADQTGSPSSAHDIADGILAVVERLEEGRDIGGVYHLAGSGCASWADFARHIFLASARHGGPVAHVREIATSDYPTKAKRPANSRLDSSRFARDIWYQAPAWQRSLEAVVARLFEAAPQQREGWTS